MLVSQVIKRLFDLSLKDYRVVIADNGLPLDIKSISTFVIGSSNEIVIVIKKEKS